MQDKLCHIWIFLHKSIFGIEANMGLEVGVGASRGSEITDVSILVVEVVNSAVFDSVFIDVLEFAYNIW